MTEHDRAKIVIFLRENHPSTAKWIIIFKKKEFWLVVVTITTQVVLFLWPCITSVASFLKFLYIHIKEYLESRLLPHTNLPLGVGLAPLLQSIQLYTPLFQFFVLSYKKKRIKLLTTGLYVIVRPTYTGLLLLLFGYKKNIISG